MIHWTDPFGHATDGACEIRCLQPADDSLIDLGAGLERLGGTLHVHAPGEGLVRELHVQVPGPRIAEARDLVETFCRREMIAPD